MANGGGGSGDNGSGGNKGAGNRTEELQPHPVKEQLPEIQYCVNSPPPWFEAVVLGFQHYMLSLGITVLIPSLLVTLMGAGDAEKAKVIQTLLFVSGLTTLFQTFFGSRLPVIAATSYAYIIPITSIISSTRFTYYTDPFERFVRTMRSIQGALIITGCFQVVVCFLGIWRNIVRFLSPLSIAPLATFTGLGLYHIGFPLLAKCVEVGLPGLILFVFITQYLQRCMKMKKGVMLWDGNRCDRYGMVLCIPVVWLFAQLLTSSGVYDHKPQTTQTSCRTDRTGLITNTPWIYIPYPFQWGSPTFNLTDSFAMMAASLVTLFESTGLFYASARYGSATPIPPSVVSRGTGWLGVGVLLNGMLGGITGITTSSENVGLLAMTKIGSRRVIQISASFMLFFSIFGKFGAFFASIPLPIMASLYCIVLCFVCSAGLSFLQFCNLNSFNTKFILGFSFFMAISVPQYFREYYNGGWRSDHRSNWLEDVIRVIFMSHTTVAAIIAIVLDCTLSRETDEAKKDCGLKWWEKFRLYNLDVRNDEFYGLPCSLNKFFPSH
ncbi:PREDICTED: putative nucleobase-ascorbate transporter 10 [Camelina sativa]|uniref:Nucleobase-ascorbate transporter 10 n=1 Tax=Camelina sativa TaxID=90675 RepID=A0ABM0XS32_CAMSA|nr:PREDICTED: putative nucleobase-ascorbate transporter 10 [Camelina sativa]